MKVEKEFVLREIAWDNILVLVGETALDFNGLITLNEVGAFLWNKLQNDITIDGLVQEVLNEYEVDEDTARKDILEFVDYLKKADIICQDGETPKKIG